MKTNKSKQGGHGATPRWKKILEAVALAAGIVYAVVTVVQWLDSRGHFKADQRAWLAPVDYSWARFEPNETMAGVVFLNSGKTPSTHGCIAAKVSILTTWAPGPLGPDPLAGVLCKPTQDVAPQNKYVEVLGDDPAITIRRYYDDIMAKRVVLYYFGELRYEDIFGTKHVSQFCFYMQDPKTKAPAACDTFNRID